MIKSSFSCIDAKLMSWATEEIEVSSAKSLVIGDRFLDRSLIYTKNRSPKIGPCHTPAGAGDHEDHWSFIEWWPSV